MSHIVIITSHMAGRINATCELTRRLRAADHCVTLASPIDINVQVAAQGMDFLFLGKEASASHEKELTKRRSRLAAFLLRIRTVTTVTARRQSAVDALDIGGFLSSMAELDPDLYLIDIELPTQIMAASSTDVPVALWTTMLSLWKRPGLPPLHTDVVPGSGWRGTRPGMELLWLRFRAWKLLRAFRHRVTRVGGDQRSILRVVASRTGFDLRTEVARYHWLVPFVYRKLPTLLFNAREIEFPHEPDPVCEFIGPILNPSRRVTAGDAAQTETTQRLEDIYARRRSGDANSLIYCSFGAWHRGDDREFFRRVITAIGRHPEWQAIVGLGARVDLELIGSVPDNVHMFDWAPQMEVLEQCDISIHHAGIGTINESVVSGVPMVVYPYDYGDTSGAAARVVYHGIGVRGDRDADQVEDIEARIMQVVGDVGFRIRVKEMSDLFDVYQRENTAVRAVEALLIRQR